MPTTKPDPRAVRIALATAGDLSYPALCRLAGPGSPEAPADLPANAPEPGAGATGRAARADAEASRIGARIVTLGEPSYPPALYDLPQPPPVLWVRGRLPVLGEVEGPGCTRPPAVAMVGSRRADRYGREVAELFASHLATHRVTVVSGFARGIDAASHEGALAGWSGPEDDELPVTIAVLGTGLGVDYPRGHGSLAERIAERGALISEFPPGTRGRPWMFPVRNRVIAALAGLTLVVRATPRSGSLSTARAAADLGRDVWAVPGRIFERRSLGTNALVRDGAGLAHHPRDLLDALEVEGIGSGPASAPPPTLDDPAEAAVWKALDGTEPRPAEALAARAGLTLPETRAALTALELADLARHGAGGGYRRAGPSPRSLPG